VIQIRESVCEAPLADIDRRSLQLDAEHPPEDLAALGIDHPDLRWHRAAAYLRAGCAAGLRTVAADVIEILILAHAKQTARRRAAQAPPVSALPPLLCGPDDLGEWTSALVVRDFGPWSAIPTGDDLEDARAWAHRTFDSSRRRVA